VAHLSHRETLVVAYLYMSWRSGTYWATISIKNPASAGPAAIMGEDVGKYISERKIPLAVSAQAGGQCPA